MNVAIIGCGTIANNAHIPALSKMEDIKVKYAVDLIISKAESAKEKLKAEFAITDYKVVLEDDDVKAVFILTPNYSHYTITMAALNAGKHVFCEKPITINYALSKEMQDLANSKNLILNIGVCNRFHRSVELIKQMNEEGKLGDIYHIYCSFREYRSIPGLGGDFTTKAKSGGGVLIDWGVHFLDLIMYITNAKARTVSASCYSELAKDISEYSYVSMWAGPPKKDGINDVEEFVTGFVRTDKASITLNGAWAQNINKREMFIDFLGSKGGIRLEYGSTYTLYTQTNGILEEVNPKYSMPNMYEQEDKAFIESIRTGIKCKSHIDYVIETAKVMDAIYASAESGSEIIL